MKETFFSEVFQDAKFAQTKLEI